MYPTDWPNVREKINSPKDLQHHMERLHFEIPTLSDLNPTFWLHDISANISIYKIPIYKNIMTLPGVLFSIMSARSESSKRHNVSCIKNANILKKRNSRFNAIEQKPFQDIKTLWDGTEFFHTILTQHTQNTYPRRADENSCLNTIKYTWTYTKYILNYHLFNTFALYYSLKWKLHWIKKQNSYDSAGILEYVPCLGSTELHTNHPKVC